jgi:hypothetical protein
VVFGYHFYYFKNLSCPSHLVDCKKRALKSKTMKYCVTRDGLGWTNPDGIIYTCVNKEEANKLVEEFH